MWSQKSTRKNQSKKIVIVSRSLNTFVLENKSRMGRDYFEEKFYSQQEKSKIIDVLMSQERVLSLLYDKTFPPRANS